MLPRFGVVVLASSLLVSCVPAPTAVPAAPAQPIEQRSANQRFQIALTGMPAAPSPESAASGVPLWFALFDPLTGLDQKLNVVPWAAEKWTQVDPLTWRFSVRKGLVFGNGDPLTAEDVAFTANLVLETRTPLIVHLGNLTSVTQVDEYSVDFVTKIPDASVLPAVSALWIMPKKYYTQVGKNGFAVKPVGSGPYELADFKSGDMAVVRKKATRHAFRNPNPTELTFRSITEGTTMVAGYKTGELDVLVGQISPDQIELLARTDAVIMSRLSSVATVLFSQQENIDRQTPLTDKRVRLALNYAVDKESIAKTIFRGYAKPTGQLSVPDSPSWDDSVQPIPYDPAMARRLLAEAGYPNGFKLPIGLEFTPLTGNPLMAQAIQSYLRDVGVEISVTQYELGVFLDKFYGRNGQSKGDLFVTGVGDTNGFGTTIYGYYTCNKPLVWWCNPDFNKNMEASVGEPDIQKRGALMRRAIATLRSDVGLLFLVVAPTFIVQGPKIKGFVWESTNLNNFDSIYRVE
ncbi:MAG: ABC transporter substrate-binding protein [Dehalococcoidia bacterium]